MTNNITTNKFEKALMEEFSKTMTTYTKYIVGDAIREAGFIFSISPIERGQIERLLKLAFNGQQIEEAEIYYTSVGKDSKLESAIKQKCVDYLETYADYIVTTAAISAGVIFDMPEQERKTIAKRMTSEFSKNIMA